jgi:hypothetical protein
VNGGLADQIEEAPCPRASTLRDIAVSVLGAAAVGGYDGPGTLHACYWQFQ